MCAGRESEAVVVLIDPTGQHNRREGKGRYFVRVQVGSAVGECRFG